MVLQLDPSLPLVWRTPTSLQFGVTRPTVVLDELDLASEKMIAALSSGISRSGLGMIGRSAGANDAQIDSLLARLRPVLLEPATREVHSVVVTGVGRFAERLAALLAGSGIHVLVAHTAEAAEGATGELAIAVGHFVLDPVLHGLWLRRDVPHLPAVLGDSSIAIGPFVEPGLTACLYCLQRHASDGDPAWPTIAAQLWGRRSPADTELMASEAAAIVARDVLARLAGVAGVRSDQLVIEAATGAQSSRRFEVHPECGCISPGQPNSMVEASAAARPGIDSGLATAYRPPTTGRAAFAPE
jgi:bacteriocin biosynthesis cyclodehydratase domain-containing protein